MSEHLDDATRDALDTLRLAVNLTVHLGPGLMDGSSIRDALAHVERALEQSRQDVAAAEQRAAEAERELERWRLRLRLRHGPPPASDWLDLRALALEERVDEYHGGLRGMSPPFSMRVMAHLRERVRLPGDVHPEDIAERHICPGCHAVDEPCLPGCIDAEIAAERERERSFGPAWEQDEEDDP